MSDNGLLKVFGFDHPDLKRIERLPVNTKCFYCDEPIRQDEAGFSMIAVLDEDTATRVYEHRACFLRGIFGSVAHIEKRCSCFGASHTLRPQPVPPVAVSCLPGSVQVDPGTMTIHDEFSELNISPKHEGHRTY